MLQAAVSVELEAQQDKLFSGPVIGDAVFCEMRAASCRHGLNDVLTAGRGKGYSERMV